MADRGLLDAALAQMANNPEQLRAVHSSGHCVVLAGPGSGKTKTLTCGIARTLLEDIQEPRGVACITYNNECALVLEARLAALDVHASPNVFVGTVHGFALSQVVAPYARCTAIDLPADFRIASWPECEEAIGDVYRELFNDGGNPKDRWRFASTKRLSQVDRMHPDWRGHNPELADFVEAYEARLRSKGLIDFDDMPLMACRMVAANPWILSALHAKFPVLFVDEYQDLGQPLHTLVQAICFAAGTRLFAVGDPDQSVYGFTGANPKLLTDLAGHEEVEAIPLRFNYRCGGSIIAASMCALGEERGYKSYGGSKGTIFFRSVTGGLANQAQYVIEALIPEFEDARIDLGRIAVLYRTAKQGDVLAAAAAAAGVPVVRSDNQALIKRSNRFARWVEACAAWVVDGWKVADPPFRRLASEAESLVFGFGAADDEVRVLQNELIHFLTSSRDDTSSANAWLRRLKKDLVENWVVVCRVPPTEWETINDLINRTDPASSEGDMSLGYFAGRTEGGGRLNLSTLHSAKGREFDAVVLFAMNNDVIPGYHEQKSPSAMRETRRLFYVGVTRARSHLALVFQKGAHSPWVKELHDRLSETES